MRGEKIPSGAALKGLATGRAIPTRQTTPVAGFQQKAEDTQNWMIMMGWKVSKLVTYGSWTTCWCPKSGRLGRVNKSVDCLLLASECHVVLLVSHLESSVKFLVSVFKGPFQVMCCYWCSYMVMVILRSSRHS